MKRRIDHFDDLSLCAIEYLERHQGVSEIILQGPVPCPGSAIHAWETRHGLRLPDDLKAFLQITNGLYLKWSAAIRSKVLPYGSMHLNNLEQFRSVAEESGYAYFDLDLKCVGGKVCLRRKISDPGTTTTTLTGGTTVTTAAAPAEEAQPLEEGNWSGVWFQDVSGAWFFIADGFTSYYRLMMTHLGIPRWQYAYTDVGLDPLTKFWFQFLSPERLKIDDCRDHTVVLTKRQSKNAKKHSLRNRRLWRSSQKTSPRKQRAKKKDQSDSAGEAPAAGYPSSSGAGRVGSRAAAASTGLGAGGATSTTLGPTSANGGSVNAALGHGAQASRTVAAEYETAPQGASVRPHSNSSKAGDHVLQMSSGAGTTSSSSGVRGPSCRGRARAGPTTVTEPGTNQAEVLVEASDKSEPSDDDDDDDSEDSNF
ncbi:unnamed protein product [Amoebophrya sp. A120]|nr:unnamed protein product [Amoebophrya sp. A120]|eukprot:GSA120T00001997001.1